MFLAGFFYGVMISLPVGPANIELLRRALHEGFKPAFEVAIGAALADALLCLFVYFGVVKTLLRSKLIYSLLGASCSFIMIYLGVAGIKAIIRKKSNVMKYISHSASRGNPITAGFVINLSNPMVIGFWVVFLGAVTSYGGNREFFRQYPVGGIFWFAFAVFSGTLAWLYAVSHLVCKSRKYISDFVFEIINFVCSTLFIIFGATLAFGVVRTIFF